MRPLSLRARAVLMCLALVCAMHARDGLAQERVNPTAQVLQDYQKRIDEYVDLRNDLKKQAPPAKETNDPAHIRAAQDGLAKRLREARRNARAGDIFTLPVRQVFRRLMYPELKGVEGAEAKQMLKEDAPAPASVPLKVNAKYPEDEPLPTVPPNLLAALPKLPEGLEYRIVRRDLILRDVDANLIVDFIPNAIR